MVERVRLMPRRRPARLESREPRRARVETARSAQAHRQTGEEQGGPHHVDQERHDHRQERGDRLLRGVLVLIELFIA
jgi:hypothetical protein